MQYKSPLFYLRLPRKILPATLCLTLMISGASAQTSQDFEAIYTFIHIRDTVAPKVHTETMGLQVRKDTMVYYSVSDIESTAEIRKELERQLAFTNELKLGQLKGYTKQILYTLSQTDEFLIESPVKGNHYIFNEKRPAVQWTLLDSVKTIAGLACQKAEAVFGGRYYTAWFAPSIPISGGPWKLHGLPGLIIEANDKTMQVQFRFVGFANHHASVYVNSRAVRTDRAGFYRMLEGLNRNPGFGNAGGTEFKVTSTSPGGARMAAGNNPLELPNR